MRVLYVEIHKTSIENLMFLHNPHGSVHPFFNETIKEIDSIDVNDPKQLARLIFLTYLFRIFPRFSPLGYYLFHMFEEIIEYLMANHNELLAFFLCRYAFRITDIPVRSYFEISNLLGNSKEPRDFF
jgi:hypothetical protein